MIFSAKMMNFSEKIVKNCENIEKKTSDLGPIEKKCDNRAILGQKIEGF